MVRVLIIDALRLAASPRAQRTYEENVPIADVVAEVLAGWEDAYHPDHPPFQEAFSAEEAQALAEFEAIVDEIAKQVTPYLGVLAFHEGPLGRRLEHAAHAALRALGA